MHIYIERIENGYVVELWERRMIGHVKTKGIFAPNEEQAHAAVSDLAAGLMDFAKETYRKIQSSPRPDDAPEEENEEQ